MNVLTAIGNINNPELRFLPDETPVFQFSFALNSGYGDKQITTWLNCSVFGKRGQTLSEMLTKGDKVGITGELINRKYKDKSGAEKFSLDCRVNDVTLLGSKNKAEGGTDKKTTAAVNSIEEMEDDIPF